jgi:peptidylprolyl isomerase
MKRLLALAAVALALPASAQDAQVTPTSIVEAAPAGDWAAIDPADLLVMDLAPDRDGNPRRVVIQLIPAPISQGWVGNIRQLAAAHWWDGTSINRVQDNYVVQWGDVTEKKPLPDGLKTVPERDYLVQRADLRERFPDLDNGVFAAPGQLTIQVDPADTERRTLPDGSELFSVRGRVTNNGADRVPTPRMLGVMRSDANRIVYTWDFPLDEPEIGPGESLDFEHNEIDIPQSAKFLDLGFKPVDSIPQGADHDPYAEETAFVGGWPTASSGEDIWPIHCYGMVGVGRNISPDTGTGAELYTVIGHAPRQLDRNIALVGRIIEGMENLSSLPRGKGELGFYANDEAAKRVPILSVRLGNEVRGLPRFEYLSTESGSFSAYAHSRANRKDDFYIAPAGGVDICNVPVPIRRAK